MNLQAGVTVVTGGAGGIGRALAERLAAAGARAVVVADLDAGGAERVATGLACPSPLGVTDGAAVAGLVKRVEDRLGPIDLAPRMAARGRGHLLLTASVAGLLTNMDSTPYRAATSSTPLASGRLADLMVRRRPGCAGHPGDGGRVLHEGGEALAAAGLDR